MDQFVAAYKDALSKYAQFSGRLSVGGYWRFVLVNFVIGVVLNILGRAVSALMIVALVYGLALIIPGLAAAVVVCTTPTRAVGWSSSASSRSSAGS